MKLETHTHVWRYVESNPTLLGPKFLAIFFSVLWFGITLKLFEIVSTSLVQQEVRQMSQIFVVALYFLVEGLVLFYLSYVLYVRHLEIQHKKKAKLDEEIKIVHTQFLKISGVSLFIYSAIGIPTMAFLFSLAHVLLGGQAKVVSNAFLSALLIWILLVSWRLLFVYPKARINKQKHVIFSAGHLVRVHMRHTITAWIVLFGVMGLVFVYKYRIDALSALEIWFATMLALLVVTVEVLLSVWEHIVVFEAKIHHAVEVQKKEKQRVTAKKKVVKKAVKKTTKSKSVSRKKKTSTKKKKKK